MIGASPHKSLGATHRGRRHQASGCPAIVTPVLLFVRKPTYGKRFDFEGIAGQIAAQRLGPNLQRAIGESASRLAARGG